MESSTAPAPTAPRGGRRRRRERLLPFLAAIALSLGAAAVVVATELGRARDRIALEEEGLAALRAVRAAEAAFHERHGRYGWIEELAGAGLLARLDVAREERRWFVRTGGYRVDVLLPHASVGTGAALSVEIAPRGARPQPDAELATRHFAVVARPLRPGGSGHRSYYLDERDELYLTEGVVDDEGAALNLLPQRQVRRAERLDTASYLLWQKAEDIPPHGP